MNEINAFERLAADVADDLMGPSRSFDTAAIVQSAKTTAPRSHWTELVQRTVGDLFAPTERGFSMFGALKFIAAGVIVALFGGFLLAGVLTMPQDDEMVPAAVTESAEPEATTATEPTEAPTRSVRTDILPGVTLTVEEVEPDVYRVVNDGLADLVYPVDIEEEHAPDIVAGHDGSIWVFLWDVSHLLGEGERGDEGYALQTARDLPGKGDRGSRLDSVSDFEVAPDGTIWAVWQKTGGKRVFGFRGADGWTTVGEWPVDGDLHVSGRDDVWAVGYLESPWFQRAHRFVDGAWRTEGQKLDRADVGVDGTLWGRWKKRLVHFDGTEWTTFEPPDWLPTDVEGWQLVEDEWVPYRSAADYPDSSSWEVHMPFNAAPWGEPHVAPDGSLWVPTRLGLLGDDPGDRPVCDHGIDGVARFDGETWSRFLQGRCVESMDIAPDGSVWLLASRSDARFPVGRTYVITPEAVAATG